MSKRLEAKVWQSALPPTLKALTAQLADMASDDGRDIYPSVPYLAWVLGNDPEPVNEPKMVRTVQRGLHDLQSMQVIKAVGKKRSPRSPSGRAWTTEYQLIEENLPARTAWQERYKTIELDHDSDGQLEDELSNQSGGDKLSPPEENATVEVTNLGPGVTAGLSGGDSGTAAGVTREGLGVTPVSPNPSGDPSSDPSVNPSNDPSLGETRARSRANRGHPTRSPPTAREQLFGKRARA